MSDRRIRLCRTHPRSFGPGSCRDPLASEQMCDIVEMVWSSDGSALLAVTECSCDNGQVTRQDAHRMTDKTGRCGGPTCDHTPSIGVGTVPCPKCGGRGYTYQANVRDINMWTDSPKVAVVPL